MDYSALREQLPELKKDAAALRREEAEAGAKAASIERIVEGIEALVGPEPSPGPQLLDLQVPEPTERLVGVAAVRAAMHEDPERIWKAGEIHQVLQDRGWLTGDAAHPLRGTEAAVNRLWKGGEIERVDRGRYRLPQRKESQNADREPEGSLSIT